MQGVLSIRKTDLKPIYIFIKPPSMEVLVSRIPQGSGVGPNFLFICNTRNLKHIKYKETKLIQSIYLTISMSVLIGKNYRYNIR